MSSSWGMVVPPRSNRVVSVVILNLYQSHFQSSSNNGTTARDHSHLVGHVAHVIVHSSMRQAHYSADFHNRCIWIVPEEQQDLVLSRCQRRV